MQLWAGSDCNQDPERIFYPTLPSQQLLCRPVEGPIIVADALQHLMLDVTNGSIEHDVHRGLPGSSVNLTLSGPLDARCPQSAPFGIAVCTGHQHIGKPSDALAATDLRQAGEYLCLLGS